MFQTIFSYAFRPLYAVAALYGALIIFIWYPLGFQGNSNLPSFFWHGHEMIWGYTGAIIVGFLLTAVSNWTASKPTQGYPLLTLVLFWLLGRIFIYLPFKESLYLSAIFDTLFYFLAAFLMALPIAKSKNNNNYLLPIALIIFGATNVIFCMGLMSLHKISLINTLQLGLLGVTGFIGLIGSRVIPFFTSMVLQKENRFSKILAMSAFMLPFVMILLIVLGIEKKAVFGIALITMLLNLYQIYRWWDNRILAHPLLWILYVGFFFTTIGIGTLGYAYGINMRYLSLSTHLISVGGIGAITLGMMSRTALGHTGRAMILPPLMITAFYLIIGSVILRILSTFTVNNKMLLIMSALLFSCSLIIYCYRYLPILISPSK